MTLPTPDYLAGMTRSEAINFINHLPELEYEEYNALMDAAEKRPERYGTHNKFRAISPKRQQVFEQRVKIVVEFIRRHKCVTRKQIHEHTRWNGANMHYALKEAIARGLVLREMTNARTFLYKAVDRSNGRQM